MNGQTDERDIGNSSNIRVPVGVLASLVAATTVFLYAQDERLHHLMDIRFQDFEARLDGKADKTQASDRYTGSQAAAVNKSFEDTHAALQRQIMSIKADMQREIDHIHHDLDKHLEECKRNHEH